MWMAGTSPAMTNKRDIVASWSGYQAKQQTPVVMGPRVRGDDTECVATRVIYFARLKVTVANPPADV